MNATATAAPPIARTRAVEKDFRRDVIRTLLYYDIWRHPLTRAELHAFLPSRTPGGAEFGRRLARLVRDGWIMEDRGYYALPDDGENRVERRLRAERHARGMWIMARCAAHLIKRFPFVRGVLVSGDLSKNATHPKSDVDFLVLTDPRRVWIARTLLILFKKTVLLNSKKFFCINAFASVDTLVVQERNVYQATEVAHLKPLFNTSLFRAYLESNAWIRGYFPNYDPAALLQPRASERSSLVQRLAELPFRLLPSDRIDAFLMRVMEKVWARRYPELDDRTRGEIFRCAPGESRSYGGNFQGKILGAYEQKLRQFGVSA